MMATQLSVMTATPRSRRRHTYVVATLAVLAGLILALSSAGQRPAASPGPTGTILIDSLVGETFTVDGDNARPPQSYSAAWEQFARRNGTDSIQPPPGVTPVFGRLTLPIGPVGPGNSMAYRVQNRPAWAYTYDLCAQGKTPSDGLCVMWLFLDPSTGEEMDMVK